MRKQSCPKHRKQAERESSQCLCMKSDTCRSHELKRRVIMQKPFSDAEEDLFIKLHSLLGNRWSLIAARLPERTENEVKNYWNSCLKSKYTKIKKRRKTLTRDHTEVLSDAESGLDGDVSVTRDLNLDLSISMTSSSHFDVENKKVQGGTCDAPSLDLETGNTRIRTLLLFQ